MEENFNLALFDFSESHVINQLCQLYIDCFNAPDKKENWDHESSYSYFQERNQEKSLFFGCFDQDKLIGTIVASNYNDSFISKELEFEREKDLYISLIATNENYRGKGISTKLLEFTLKQAKSKSFDSLSVRCRKDNLAVQGLLSKYEFQETFEYESELGGVTCTRIFLTRDISSL